MSPNLEALTASYLEHLTPDDVAVLLGEDPQRARRGDKRELLRLGPARLEELLAQPRVFDAVFGPGSDADPSPGMSPFLAFAVAVHRAGAELGSAAYVAEWLGPGRRAPVFDADKLREFMSAPWRRFFLAELLASYTRVASGSVLVPTRRGWRRLRFSELDPVRLAGLLDAASEAERPGILRRLGDLALFLTGVFPDYVERHGFSSLEEGRLLRSGGIQPGGAHRQRRPALAALGDGGAVGLLDELGRRWYRAAFELLPHPAPKSVEVIGELPERFGQARRLLGLVTERFIFAYRDRWFSPGG